MKKRVILITACLLLFSLMATALAPGDAGDPLISLSYLTGAFTKQVDQKVEEKLDASDAALAGGDTAGSLSSIASTWVSRASPSSSKVRSALSSTTRAKGSASSA